MTPVITRYALDPTGVSPDNLVQGELHTMVRRKVRAIAANYGAFFTASLRVVDTATNTELTSSQYYAAEMYELPTARYGKEICALIIITDENVGDEVSITYQALGGEYSTSMTAILQQIEALSLDDRPVSWGNLILKPDQFPPSHHLHDIGDVYGFEYAVHAIDRVRAAILMGDDISHDVIYKYIDRADAQIVVSVTALTNSVNAHLADYNNPHHTTADQLNVYTKPVVDTMISTVNTTLTNALNAHVNNKNNPHNVTPAQLNVYTKPETDSLINTVNNNLTTALNNHINNKSNPHNVTAAQLNVYTKPEIDSQLSTMNTTLTTAINVAATKANWTGISGFNNYNNAVQILNNFPTSGYTSNARPVYFFNSNQTGLSSMDPTQLPAGSITGFDEYNSTDLGSYQTGISVVSGRGGGVRAFQLMANWNFEEGKPAGGLRYRVNDDTGDSTKWGQVTTLWDDGNLTKLSQLQNDLNFSTGAVGGGTDKVFYENDQVVANSYTLTAGKNAMSTGPITINDGVVVTIPNGSVWTIL